MPLDRDLVDELRGAGEDEVAHHLSQLLRFDVNDVKFLLAIAMHTADIANPAKPLKVCLQWTELVMEEFFRQGDLEAKLGMPISPFYDREKTSTAACQMGFINVLVKPVRAGARRVADPVSRPTARLRSGARPAARARQRQPRDRCATAARPPRDRCATAARPPLPPP